MSTIPKMAAHVSDLELSEEPASFPLAGRRVLIIVENLPLPFDRRVWLEARTLTAAGAKVSIICPTGKGFEKRFETIEGVDIYRHPLPIEADSAMGYLREYGAALFHEMRLALKIFSRGGFDVIQACNPPDFLFLVALPFKLFGVRFIFDHHDINPELYEAKFGKRGFFWMLLVLFEKLTFKTADAVICTNESYRRIAMERGGKPYDDTFVVRSGPELRKLKQMPPTLGWHNGRKYLVGYVGVMGEQEGLDLLLDAVRELVIRRNRTDIQFVLVGGGSSLEELRQMKRSYGLLDYVTFTGRVSDEDLFSVLSSADVCVNPDRVNTMNDLSTMNKIMEYMAFAKPIVQFDVKEGRHSAQEASLYAKANDPIDLADQISWLLDHPEERERMGLFGKQRLQNELSWEHQVDTLIAAYQHALR